MDRFRISVVIPTKSNLNGLRATVEALWSIDSHRIEIIVVDGGGCAETKAWLLTHQHRIHHIRSAADGGVYPAMNYGKQCASGHWVWFAGAGDLPHAEAWSEFLEEDDSTEDAPALHVFGVELGDDREGGVPARYPARWDSSMQWRNTTHHQGVLYRRDLIQSCTFDPSFRVLADYALHLSLWTQGIDVAIHEETWSQVASGGLSRVFHARLYWEEWKMKKEVLSGWIKWAQPFWLTGKYLAKRVSRR